MTKHTLKLLRCKGLAIMLFNEMKTREPRRVFIVVSRCYYYFIDILQTILIKLLINLNWTEQKPSKKSR